MPTVQARVATCAVGTPFHTWQTVAQGKTPAAHKGMVYAAKVMAATAKRLIEDPALKEDLAGLLRDNQALLFFVVLGFGYLLGKIKIKGSPRLMMAFARCFPS